jgi:deazaflavin-dependent oxidoreductase (nitroreductase family)
VRAPIWLYQHGMGWLFGRRMIMVEHTGRISGLPRFVCLEVAERQGPNVVIVASGFGRQAQWYQNLEAHPLCRVSIGSRVSASARARFMSDIESEAAIKRYQAKHPIAWRQLRGAIEHATHQRVHTLPMVEISLTPGTRSTPA